MKTRFSDYNAAYHLGDFLKRYEEENGKKMPVGELKQMPNRSSPPSWLDQDDHQQFRQVWRDAVADLMEYEVLEDIAEPGNPRTISASEANKWASDHDPDNC